MDASDLIDELIEREGGYSARAADKGGPTRFGISEAVARAHGYKGDMAKLPRDTAAAIYRADYWAKPGLDRIADLAPMVAAELFDTGVNMGTGTAAGFLRRALNALNRGGADYADIPASGTVDTAALGALKAFLRTRGPAAETVLVKALDALQGALALVGVVHRRHVGAFLYGWLANRIGER